MNNLNKEKTYSLVYEEDKLDNFLKGVSRRDKKSLTLGYHLISDNLTRMKGKKIIDEVLYQNDVAYYLPTGTILKSSNICGFNRVLESLEIAL